MPLKSHVVESDESAQIYECALVWVRPDGHMCCCSNAEPDSPEINIELVAEHIRWQHRIEPRVMLEAVLSWAGLLCMAWKESPAG